MVAGGESGYVNFYIQVNFYNQVSPIWKLNFIHQIDYRDVSTELQSELWNVNSTELATRKQPLKSSTCSLHLLWVL